MDGGELNNFIVTIIKNPNPFRFLPFEISITIRHPNEIVAMTEARFFVITTDRTG
jgi:hypothetical protein